MSDRSLRIGFMGTPDFSVPALAALCESAHEVVCVYSQPPRPKGRGHQVQNSPVHAYAETQGVPVFTPKSLKSEDVQAVFAAHDLDVAVVAAYGLILPKAILDAPRHGCLNIHASLLPRWRGASPIQQAIWAGDGESGISIMQMDEGLDTGPVIAMEQFALSDDMTASVLHDALSEMGARMSLAVVETLAAGGTLSLEPQDNDLVTYAPLLKKEDGRVDWSQTAIEIGRQVRALNPWPGVWSDIDGTRIKILDAQVIDEVSDQVPGIVLGRDGYVSCGGGTVLGLRQIQPAGTKAMDVSAAMNGGYLQIGKGFS